MANVNTIEWAYCRVAYLLDVEEVVWGTVEAVRAHDIREPAELVEALVSGDVRTWPKVTPRGVRGLFKVLKHLVDAETLARTIELYK